MGTLEEIKNLQQQGKSEEEIKTTLKSKGKSEEEINNALSQAKIKEAVSKPPQTDSENAKKPLEVPTPESPEAHTNQTQTAGNEPKKPMIQETPLESEKMQPSMATPSEQAPTTAKKTSEETEVFPDSVTSNQKPEAQTTQSPPPENLSGKVYPSPVSQPYNSQQSPQNTETNSGVMLSSETISEIAEQTVNEKLSGVRDSLEKIIDFRTTVESKINYLEERLKRIEKIIDELQISILKRVGEYLTNTEDIKKELHETQKSFKSMIEKKEKTTNSSHS